MATAPEERIVGGSGGQGAKKVKGQPFAEPAACVFSFNSQCESYLPVTAEETDAQSG